MAGKIEVTFADIKAEADAVSAQADASVTKINAALAFSAPQAEVS